MKQNMLKFAGILLAGVPMLASAGTESQTFDTEASAAAAGWTLFNNTAGGNNFGWRNSANASGPAGEAGGTFSMSTSATFGYYADTTLGGSLTFNDTISASGKITINNLQNPNNRIFLGHFDPTSGARPRVSLDFQDGDTPNGTVRWRAEIQGIGFALQTGNDYVPIASLAGFSYLYNPNDGFGKLTVNLYDSANAIIKTGSLSLTEAQRANAAAFTAFGSGNLALSTADFARKYDMYYDNITYTVVPEPSALGLLSLGGLLFLGRRRSV